MIAIDDEELLTLSEATKRLPHGRAGKSVHVATLHRWASLGGLQGVRLETVKIGGMRYTSAEALERFIERCTNPGITRASRTTRARERQIKQAEVELAEAGI